jgi:heptosyltransferase-3
VKILVIQLTRLGDILCTLPTLSALRRENPDAQIHILIRKSFSEAATLSRAVDHYWHLDSEKLLSPIILEQGAKEKSLSVLSDLINQLRAEGFDKIINLSFSPSSSYITHLISRGKVATSGFTRTEDFYLSVPDEASRYFRAQAGTDGNNRLHVIDLFAWVSNLRLRAADICLLASNESNADENRHGVICHLGASQKQKMWPLEYWLTLIRQLTEKLGVPVTLVGGGAFEKSLGQMIEQELKLESRMLNNQIGKADLKCLSEFLKKSKLFIGADSGPLHMASLTNTRSLNLSVGDVRFWETGPVTVGSRVLCKQNAHYLTPDTVFVAVAQMLKNLDATHSMYLACVNENGPRFESQVLDDSDACPSDQWDVTKWLYFKGAKPSLSEIENLALAKCIEAGEIALEQMDAFFKDPRKIEIPGILDRLDQVIGLIGHKYSKLSPLIDDFFCEKSNIPPGSREEVFCQTDVCYKTLVSIAKELQPPAQTIISHRTKGSDHEA